MLNQTSPMEHLTAFAICWVFGMASCVITQMAWQYSRENRRIA